jgi:tetratricopeptide (TPR) repeat protein
MVLYKPLSEYYHKTNNYKEAMNYLSKWIEKNPNDAKSIIKMGDYALKLNDNRGAIIYYKNSLSIDTTNTYLRKEIERIENNIQSIADTSKK